MTAAHVIERGDFDALLEALAGRGYTVLGPTVRDQTIVYDEIERASDLPVGWTDEQDGGRYRLVRREDEALFGYAVGPQSWKQYQLPASLTCGARRSARTVSSPSSPSPRAIATATRSSVRARASCRGSGFSTACCSAGAIPIPLTGPARTTCSSSPSSADRRAERASASR